MLETVMAKEIDRNRVLRPRTPRPEVRDHREPREPGTTSLAQINAKLLAENNRLKARVANLEAFAQINAKLVAENDRLNAQAVNLKASAQINAELMAENDRLKAHVINLEASAQINAKLMAENDRLKAHVADLEVSREHAIPDMAGARRLWIKLLAELPSTDAVNAELAVLEEELNEAVAKAFPPEQKQGGVAAGLTFQSGRLPAG
jgi:hypothetical protein